MEQVLEVPDFVDVPLPGTDVLDFSNTVRFQFRTGTDSPTTTARIVQGRVSYEFKAEDAPFEVSRDVFEKHLRKTDLFEEL